MSRTTRILITVLGGWFGLHKYMDKKIGMGLLYTCTFGLFGIGWIIDIISVCRTPSIYDRSGEFKTEEFLAMGTCYYLDNIGKLACSNPNWKKKNATIVKDGYAGKKIFRYNYINKPVKLIEEPDNPHDPNAIMILIAGELVGYIAAAECLHVKDILGNHQIKYISSFIGGGQYKVISDSLLVVKDELDIHVTVKIGYV